MLVLNFGLVCKTRVPCNKYNYAINYELYVTYKDEWLHVPHVGLDDHSEVLSAWLIVCAFLVDESIKSLPVFHLNVTQLGIRRHVLRTVTELAIR